MFSKRGGQYLTLGIKKYHKKYSISCHMKPSLYALGEIETDGTPIAAVTRQHHKTHYGQF